MLAQEGYLQEKFQDIYKIYSLSTKGARFLGITLLAANLFNNTTTQSLTPDAQGKEILDMQPSVEMIAEQEKEARFAKPKEVSTTSKNALSKFGDTAIENLHALLLKLCYLQAQARSVAPYMILGGQVLEKLAILRPTTVERFRDIEGVDEQKAIEFGPLFTEAIKASDNTHCS